MDCEIILAESEDRERIKHILSIGVFRSAVPAEMGHVCGLLPSALTRTTITTTRRQLLAMAIILSPHNNCTQVMRCKEAKDLGTEYQ